MVRLRASISLIDKPILKYFNSSVVRLRGVKHKRIIEHLNIFQFQCGAIEGQANGNIHFHLIIFQFQCGAIEGLFDNRHN